MPGGQGIQRSFVLGRGRLPLLLSLSRHSLLFLLVPSPIPFHAFGGPLQLGPLRVDLRLGRLELGVEFHNVSAKLTELLLGILGLPRSPLGLIGLMEHLGLHFFHPGPGLGRFHRLGDGCRCQIDARRSSLRNC